MGILNTTPDSFYDGGLYQNHHLAFEHALKMVENGADIIDIGGESSRPGSDPVAAEDELKRVIPVIKLIRKETDAAISIDTTKSAVAKAALDAGANIINDISALSYDPQMADVAQKSGAPVILMHIKGTPKSMQDHPFYSDVISEICSYLQSRIEYAVESGIKKSKIIIDPGIGFGKRVEDNFEIINSLTRFKNIGCPVLVGPSRKSFIGAVLNVPPRDRKAGTTAAVAVSIVNGADIIRVHDVYEMAQVAKMVDLLTKKQTIC
ncbi:dihydropteroate synthase [candidate division KSB1 bacterium]|nr:dihydropteroate synthase [candidate division KSB1 bacterium]